jgi:hypothetical protein
MAFSFLKNRTSSLKESKSLLRNPLLHRPLSVSFVIFHFRGLELPPEFRYYTDWLSRFLRLPSFRIGVSMGVVSSEQNVQGIDYLLHLPQNRSISHVRRPSQQITIDGPFHRMNYELEWNKSKFTFGE